MSAVWALGVIFSSSGSLFSGPRRPKTLDIHRTMKQPTRSRSLALIAGFLVVGGCANSEPGTTNPGPAGSRVAGTGGTAAPGPAGNGSTGNGGTRGRGGSAPGPAGGPSTPGTGGNDASGAAGNSATGTAGNA